MNPEDQQILTPESENQHEIKEENLVISGEISGYLKVAAQWGKFLAILGFIFTGLIVFGGVIMSVVLSFMPFPSTGFFPIPTFLIGFIYLILGLVYFFPALYLFRFSNGIDSAFRLNDQARLTKAFYYLKAQYRYLGILMIVLLAMYVIFFIAMIFMGIFAGGMGGFPGMPA